MHSQQIVNGSLSSILCEEGIKVASQNTCIDLAEAYKEYVAWMKNDAARNVK